MPDEAVPAISLDGPPGRQGEVMIFKPGDFDSPMYEVHPHTSHFSGGFFAYWNALKGGVKMGPSGHFFGPGARFLHCS